MISPMVEPLADDGDHVRGEPGTPVILEYGDYECPYSRQAFRSIERVERELSGRVRFAFRHFPLIQIHPHALAAAAGAEAAARQGRFWEMHELLFHRQKALEEAIRYVMYVVLRRLVFAKKGLERSSIYSVSATFRIKEI